MSYSRMVSRSEFLLVEWDGEKPTGRVIDVSAHIAATYADLTIGEIVAFAQKRKRVRKDAHRAAVAAFKKRLGYEPSRQEWEVSPERAAWLARFEDHVRIETGHIRRSAPAETRMADWWDYHQVVDGRLKKYAEEVLRALGVMHPEDEILRLFVR